MIKPPRLRKGDTVALITLSWGGASRFKERYNIGKNRIKELGLKVIETPNALKSEKWVYNHPKERLEDLIWAFKNKEVKAIISIIGGDDSIRLLDYLTKKHLRIIKKNPKIFIGFSDTTIINFILLKAGLTSFYGPSVLFGFAENKGVNEYTLNYFKKALFSEKPIGEIKNAEGWTIDYIPWKKGFNNIKRRLQKPLKIKFINGKGITKGKLIGGTTETLEIMKNTILWPKINEWNNKVLFIDNSEIKPPVELFTYWLRNYGAQGILKRLKGIIFSIPTGEIKHEDANYNKKVKEHKELIKEYEKAIIKVCKEYGREDMIIASRVNFGHIYPMITIPYDCNISLDAVNKKISIVENSVT